MKQNKIDKIISESINKVLNEGIIGDQGRMLMAISEKCPEAMKVFQAIEQHKLSTDEVMLLISMMKNCAKSNR